MLVTSASIIDSDHGKEPLGIAHERAEEEPTQKDDPQEDRRHLGDEREGLLLDRGRGLENRHDQADGHADEEYRPRDDEYFQDALADDLESHAHHQYGSSLPAAR